MLCVCGARHSLGYDGLSTATINRHTAKAHQSLRGSSPYAGGSRCRKCCSHNGAHDGNPCDGSMLWSSAFDCPDVREHVGHDTGSTWGFAWGQEAVRKNEEPCSLVGATPGTTDITSCDCKAANTPSISCCVRLLSSSALAARCASMCSAMAHLLSPGLLGQLGPDQVPVVGAKVAASYSATCGTFDGDAVNRPRPSVAVGVLPLPYLCITGGSNEHTKFADRQCARAR